MSTQRFKKATLAGGCFWCIEGIFQQLKGVTRVVSGYCGGQSDNPSYDDLHSGEKGHAESVQITYDPKIISYRTLLEVFFTLHDPTTFNRQGPDIGPEYRSAIFYHDDRQQKIAEEVRRQFEDSGLYDDSIITEIIPLDTFFKAEEQHQNFYKQRKNPFYCSIMIDPKIKKLRKSFPDKVD